jgi:AAHS family 4-hydroxybenzoate transporter-like MFS transporter
MNTGEIKEFQPRLTAESLSRFQVTVFLLCAFVAMLDGFDTQIIALAAPDIVVDWKIAPVSFAGVFASGLLGALVGALVFGAAADKIGRKPSLLVAIALFGLVSLLTPSVASIRELTMVRFFTGIGLGGALPGVIAVTSEFAPRRRRAAIVSLMFCGFPLGAVVGGVVAALMVPAYGWKVLFYIGGVVPLLLLPVLAAVVPESIRFLSMRGKKDKLDAVLRRMQVSQSWLEESLDEDAQSDGEIKWGLLKGLFGEGKALGTVILTGTFLLSLLLSYFLVNWLPLLSRQAGVGARYAVLGVAALNLGAIAGCLAIGRLTNHEGPVLPIGLAYTIGGGAIALIGLSANSGALLLSMCFCAGALSIGAQMCIVGLAATFYETSVRATGVGWLLGTGRIGAILGPIFGGILISHGVAAPSLFLIAGGVSFCAALGVFLLGAYGFRDHLRPHTEGFLKVSRLP